MQLDEGCTDFAAGVELLGIGVDEETDQPAFVRQGWYDFGEPAKFAAHIQTTLGCHLIAVLRHETEGVRAAFESNPNHFWIEAALKIEQRRDVLAQVDHVLVLDVTSVLA